MEPDGRMVGRYAEVAGPATVAPPAIQSGLPIAITVSPLTNLSESPSGNARRFIPSILNTARKVGKEIAAHKCPPECAPVRQCEREFFKTLHHMIVRRDVALSVHDHPGAPARLGRGLVELIFIDPARRDAHHGRKDPSDRGRDPCPLCRRTWASGVGELGTGRQCRDDAHQSPDRDARGQRSPLSSAPGRDRPSCRQVLRYARMSRLVPLVEFHQHASP